MSIVIKEILMFSMYRIKFDVNINGLEKKYI